MATQVRLPTRHASTFHTGHNCWRVEKARRASFLIDGDAYFTAFRAAAIRAQQSIMILGWDFDSRTRMVIDREPDGFPGHIGDFSRTSAPTPSTPDLCSDMGSSSDLQQRTRGDIICQFIHPSAITYREGRRPSGGRVSSSKGRRDR